MLSFEGQRPAFGLPKYEKHPSGLGYQWSWKCRQASAESQVDLKQLIIVPMAFSLAGVESETGCCAGTGMDS